MKPHHPLHPLCSIFPQMSDEEFDALRDDIEQHGQRDAIVLWDGQILDGRHRMQACLALGIEPKFRTVEMSWEEAKAYVLSVNLTRRHLDASQRAIIANRMATLEQGQQAVRVGSLPNAQICAFGNSPTSIATTQAAAAQMLNVSPRQVQVARKVEEITAPELFSKCESGEISLHKAGKLAAAVPDKAEQAEIVRAGRVDEVLRKALPPEEPPQLPKTNTHHTSANRRTPDARETDRQGLVSPEDPCDLQDGRLYVWRESANRLFLATPEEIREAAMEVIPDKLAANSGASIPDSCDTKKVVERERDTKRFVRPTVAQVAAYAAEIGAAIDPEQFCDFYESKAWMIGKNKMKDWKAAVRTWKRGQAGKAGAVENGKVRSANWEDDGTGWEDLRDG